MREEGSAREVCWDGLRTTGTRIGGEEAKENGAPEPIRTADLLLRRQLN
jgi:hypothetical protein